MTSTNYTIRIIHYPACKALPLDFLKNVIRYLSLEKTNLRTKPQPTCKELTGYYLKVDLLIIGF